MLELDSMSSGLSFNISLSETIKALNALLDFIFIKSGISVALGFLVLSNSNDGL